MRESVSGWEISGVGLLLFSLPLGLVEEAVDSGGVNDCVCLGGRGGALGVWREREGYRGEAALGADRTKEFIQGVYLGASQGQVVRDVWA